MDRSFLCAAGGLDAGVLHAGGEALPVPLSGLHVGVCGEGQASQRNQEAPGLLQAPARLDRQETKAMKLLKYHCFNCDIIVKSRDERR